jgi:hypothetical protein
MDMVDLSAKYSTVVLSASFSLGSKERHRSRLALKRLWIGRVPPTPTTQTPHRPYHWTYLENVSCILQMGNTNIGTWLLCDSDKFLGLQFHRSDTEEFPDTDRLTLTYSTCCHSVLSLLKMLNGRLFTLGRMIRFTRYYTHIYICWGNQRGNNHCIITSSLSVDRPA